MNQTQLRQYLDRFVSTLDRSNRELLDARLQGLVSVFPFNEYEYILMFLLGKNVIRFEQYEKLRDTYVSANKVLGALWPRTMNFWPSMGGTTRTRFAFRFQEAKQLARS